MTRNNDFALPPWARVGDPPTATARMRAQPDDFQVTEDLGFAPSGDGPHDFLYVEKVGLGTDRVAQDLAKFAGVPKRSVSYSGMKDVRARTRQWFSVERPPGRQLDWAACSSDSARVLDICQNRKKLRRGVHRGNAFRITLRGVSDPDGSIESRLRRVAAEGVPNYFGEQRFGREGGNIGLARSLFAGRKLPRHLRSIAISAARSLIFNDVLSARVEEKSWNRLLAGDVANLDGSGSVFSVDALDATLEARCRSFDLHPTGPLWGRGAPQSARSVAAAEQRAADAHPGLRSGLEGIAEGARRALRMRVSDLAWEFSEDALVLSFHLATGCFATAVIRELINVDT